MSASGNWLRSDPVRAHNRRVVAMSLGAVTNHSSTPSSSVEYHRLSTVGCSRTIAAYCRPTRRASAAHFCAAMCEASPRTTTGRASWTALAFILAPWIARPRRGGLSNAPCFRQTQQPPGSLPGGRLLLLVERGLGARGAAAAAAAARAAAGVRAAAAAGRAGGAAAARRARAAAAARAARGLATGLMAGEALVLGFLRGRLLGRAARLLGHALYLLGRLLHDALRALHEP